MKTIKLLLFFILLICLAATAFGGEALNAARAGDFDKAFKLWSIEASNGDPIAQYFLGTMYDSGDGIPKDYSEAAKWYRKAADQGHASAQIRLGNMFFYGKGVPRDHEEAVKWFRLAAEQGDASGQSNLGNMYFNGDGVLQSFEEGYAWTLVAQANGHAMASDNLRVYRGIMAPSQIDSAQYKANEIMGRLYSARETTERRARLANSTNETIERRTDFEKKFIVVLTRQLPVDLENLSGETRFREDLDADDLDLIELLMALEDYFDISVGDAQWAGITTVESAVDLLFEIKNSSRW